MDYGELSYNEIIRKKKVMDLASYFYLSDDLINELYTFLLTFPAAAILCGRANMTLFNGNENVKTITVQPKNYTFDAIRVTNTLFSVTPHYTPTTRAYGGGGSSGGSSWSSGGGSSNNNNNNNNR